MVGPGPPPPRLGDRGHPLAGIALCAVARWKSRVGAATLAGQWGQRPPEWTQKVGPSPEPLFLVQAAHKMARLKKLCELEGRLTACSKVQIATPQ